MSCTPLRHRLISQVKTKGRVLPGSLSERQVWMKYFLLSIPSSIDIASENKRRLY
mgnify:CR=1 FL=1